MFKSVVRMTDGSEKWPMKKTYENKLSVVEMRLLTTELRNDIIMTGND